MIIIVKFNLKIIPGQLDWDWVPETSECQDAVSGARLASNFLAGLHSLFIGQNCRFEQRFTREFRAYKTRDELHFTSVLSFLAVQNMSILLMQFRIVTLHCAWQPS